MKPKKAMQATDAIPIEMVTLAGGYP